jgi:hypothetical protein
MFATASAELPVLDSVTGCKLLVDFTKRGAKLSVKGETLAAASVAVVSTKPWNTPFASANTPVTFPESLILAHAVPGNKLVPAVPAPGASIGAVIVPPESRKKPCITPLASS